VTPSTTKNLQNRSPERDEGSTGEAILEVAVDLFAERGYHATSMREIAEAVPVRPAGIYHWFENKEAILIEMQERFLTDLTDVVVAAVARHGRPEGRLAAAVREHVVFHGLHTKAAFVTDSEIRALSQRPRAAVIERRDVYQDLFIGLIEDGVGAGVFHAPDVRITSYAILLQCTGVALWFDPKGSRALEEVAAIHIELVLSSLGVNRRSIGAAIKGTERAATAAREAAPAHV
jgi:AcrR family transcriptional regulator